MTNRAYDFNLASGLSTRLDVSGSYLKLLSASAGAVGIKVDGGSEILLKPGQGYRVLAQKDGQINSFRDVTVRNLQSSTNAGSIYIGTAGFEDSRITGDVTIVDSFGAALTRYTTPGILTVTAFSAQALILPAANVNGLILRQYALGVSSSGTTGAAISRIVASPSTPTGFGNPVTQFVFTMLTATSTQIVSAQDSKVNKLVPPGWGIYLLSIISTIPANNNDVELCAELL